MHFSLENENAILLKPLFFCLVLLYSDVDECNDGTNDCDVNADCVNIDGSFQCTCRADYTGDGKTCTGGS